MSILYSLSSVCCQVRRRADTVQNIAYLGTAVYHDSHESYHEWLTIRSDSAVSKLRLSKRTRHLRLAHAHWMRQTVGSFTFLVFHRKERFEGSCCQISRVRPIKEFGSGALCPYSAMRIGSQGEIISIRLHGGFLNVHRIVKRVSNVSVLQIVIRTGSLLSK